MPKTILDYDTVALDDGDSSLIIIDQTKLPNDLVMLHLRTQKEIYDAIYLLEVRGAPAIGVAAAYGIYLAAKGIDTDDYDEFATQFDAAKDYLASSRPTAVNLTWALNRMRDVVTANKTESVAHIKELLLAESRKIQQEDIDTCRMIGENGLTLLHKGDGIITHCNAGQLATSKYGTATAPMYLGQKRDYGFHIYCDETRPLLQGARLTSYELMSAGLDVTLMCDGMAASIMKRGLAQAVITGCDRVAANGDAANKIGTMPLAIAAKHFGVPFYICAPSSTIDMKTATGDDIVIEERKPSEVTDMWYEHPMAPKGIKVFNPAFDVTDASLITAIITEKGVIYPPFDKSIKKIMG